MRTGKLADRKNTIISMLGWYKTTDKTAGASREIFGAYLKKNSMFEELSYKVSSRQKEHVKG